MSSNASAQPASPTPVKRSGGAVRVWGPWAFLGVVLVVALSVVVLRSQPSTSSSARAARLDAEFRCPTCESESVADSQAPAAAAIRADVKQRIAAGESDGEIKAAYVAIYTQYVLLSPDSHGIGILVWGAPVAALILGGGGLALALRRWSRQPRLAATVADEERVARARGES
jgi:cytochrome c-type biogenesis protein CcmH